MATIENMKSPEAHRAFLLTLSGPELVAQQLVQRAAEDALKTLQLVGVNEQNCATMLESLRHGLLTIHEVAIQKHIELPNYS